MAMPIAGGIERISILPIGGLLLGVFAIDRNFSIRGRAWDVNFSRLERVGFLSSQVLGEPWANTQVRPYRTCHDDGFTWNIAHAGTGLP